ncbi:MAG TPA: sigma-70 family RNA polymerase sigma factor [Nitriliruptorales bacterium]|nr:sigma-70 family RNA polymerase sigma factor [Nitriliruptorales bacterium]
MSHTMDPDVAEATHRNEAFRQHVVPELEVLLRVATRLTGDPVEAEDLVQETLIRAYRAVDRFDGRYPRAWLLTILRNTHRNMLRRRRVLIVDSSHEILARAPARGADGRDGAAEHVLDATLDTAVGAALRALSDDFRRVVVLVDIEGLTYQETADVLDIPVGTVMSRLHRARRRMRDRLEGAPHQSGGRR